MRIMPVEPSPRADANGPGEPRAGDTGDSQLLVSAREVAEWRRSEELLRALIEGTSPVTGTEFFRSLVRHLAAGIHVRWAFVAECLPHQRARALAYWQDTDFGPDFEYDLQGTPCLEVAQGRVCHVPDRLPERFPEDRGMIDLGTVSYLGVPLWDSGQRTIGHLVLFDDKPMPADPLVLSVLQTFASRAGAELERRQAEAKLRQKTEQALADSETRFRDLFDEAPIAYVHEGVDTRFIRANRAAMRILGIKPEDVPGTYGKTFIPDTPEAQRRLAEALESIGRGTDTSGVILELRRKDNGKPLWIQWWSRPDVSGDFTRTMFIDITDRVLMEREKKRLEAQNTYLQEEIRSEHNFGDIVGNSDTLAGVLRQVDQVAPADSTALIVGETGTGKELIARAIHDRSRRRNRPLVKVNCGAISAGLVESELFGHVKGAFTGALANRDGRFKVADGGTLFLDEVGELPLDTQVKLLRVLQEQEFEPIGSSTTLKVDVRIIAATNRDLAAAVAEGKFRRDLYYRLDVFPIHVPPLRDRAGDIPLLTAYFLQRFARKLGKNVHEIPSHTLDRLIQYAWPGNIRELQNVIERATLISTGQFLELAPDFAPITAPPPAPPPAAPTPSTAPPPLPAAGSTPQPESQSQETESFPLIPDGRLEDVERRHIEAVLLRTNWMIEGQRGAAKILNLNPSTLRSRMQKLGIRRPTVKASNPRPPS